MSLKAFHVAFIFLCNLLALGFGAWCLRELGDTGDSMFGILGGLSLVAFVGLFVYGVWFVKKSRHLSYFVWAGMMLVGTDAWACPVCLGNPNSPLVIGANNGVMFLMGVICTLLVGLGAIFLVWRKREKAWIQKNEPTLHKKLNLGV